MEVYGLQRRPVNLQLVTARTGPEILVLIPAIERFFLMLFSITLLLLASVENRPQLENSLTLAVDAHTEFCDPLLGEIDLVLLVK